MDIFILLYFLILGLFVGSFLNVVILRWDTGKSFVTGRSVCAHTGNTLPWYDLVPVVSFVVLRGKSRFSGQALSMQYPLVELLTGLLFMGTYWKLFIVGKYLNFNFISILIFVIYLAIMSLLIVIAFYDLRTKIIPNQFVYSFIILAGLLTILQHGSALFTYSGSLNILAAIVLWFPFAFLWFVSAGKWMGYGDAKLAWGIGWMLGLVAGISAIMYSFWIGAIISVALVLFKKVSEKYMPALLQNLTIKSEIPFAPFLVIGTLLVFFFDFNIYFLF